MGTIKALEASLENILNTRIMEDAFSKSTARVLQGIGAVPEWLQNTYSNENTTIPTMRLGTTPPINIIPDNQTFHNDDDRINQDLKGAVDYLTNRSDKGSVTDLSTISPFYLKALQRSILLLPGNFIPTTLVQRHLGGKLLEQQVVTIMTSLTLPRSHPAYVGEVKKISAHQVFFYKCPPNLTILRAIAHFGIEMASYKSAYYTNASPADMSSFNWNKYKQLAAANSPFRGNH